MILIVLMVLTMIPFISPSGWDHRDMMRRLIMILVVMMIMIMMILGASHQTVYRSPLLKIRTSCVWRISPPALNTY